MKLDDLVLSLGSSDQVRNFIADLLQPYIVHDEDMIRMVQKICDAQARIPTPAHFSVSMWDIAWPDRAWTFCHKFRLYNKPSNDPALTKYVDPVIQFSISKNQIEITSVLVYHKLLYPLSR